MRKRTILSLVALLGILAPRVAHATPEAAEWHRETLVGENRDFYFALRATRTYPGSYYAYSEELSLVKVAKANRSIAETVTLQRRECSQDFQTEAWTCGDDSIPQFDLGAYLRHHAVRIPFAEDWPQDLRIDSAGVYLNVEDVRATVLPWDALQRQLPDLGDEPRIVGLEATQARLLDGAEALYFCRVQSNTTAIDDDWSEDLLLVPEALVDAANSEIGNTLARRRSREKDR